MPSLSCHKTWDRLHSNAARPGGRTNKKGRDRESLGSSASDLIWDREIFPFAWVLWSVGLAVYYSRSFVRALRVRARH